VPRELAENAAVMAVLAYAIGSSGIRATFWVAAAVPLGGWIVQHAGQDILLGIGRLMGWSAAGYTFLVVLPSYDAVAEVAVRSAGVAVDAHALRQVEHDGDGKDVVGAGESDQLPA
jgi:hypothetical protein